jgi:hypothetical protein
MNPTNSRELEAKWKAVLDHAKLPAIRDNQRRAVTAQLLENTVLEAQKAAEAQGGFSLLTEDAPANQSGVFPNATNLKGYDPIMISLVRRAAPNLIAYDICGVQPMTGPTGLIFALKSRYSSQGGTEALFNEANTAFSGANLAGSHTGTTPGGSNSTNYTAGTGMLTLEGEGLGTSGNTAIPEMAFSIDKVTVTAVTRALKAEYTIEIAQDLKAVHGLDAEAELANILSSEILTEINREVIRTIGFAASNGAQHNVATAGTFDLDVDSNGRWSKERWQGLIFQIERDANAIAKATRRGKGNVLLTSSDVASALALSGQLDYTPAMEQKTQLQSDDTGPTFVGILNGRYRVYIDPYVPAASSDFVIVGYKGQSPYDAGLFYCPYVPLQMMRATDPGSFQPKIGFKTRYGMKANPFATSAGDGAISFATNVYYRKFVVANLA